MKTKFKVSDLNEVEKKIVLAMLNNSQFTGAFIIEAIRPYVEKILTTTEEGLQKAIGGLIHESLWRDIARQLNTDLALGIDEYIETPRGRFRYGFYSKEKAEAAGYSLYCTENAVDIVANGERAFAVRK